MPSTHPPTNDTPPAPTETPRFVSAITGHPWRTIVVACLIALLALYLLWDWNWFKKPIERQVESITGRTLNIGGDLDVELGRITTVTADDVVFSNAAWAKAQPMASADRVQVQFRPVPLLFKRRIEIPEIRLTKPDVLLETGPKGKGNWDFDLPASDRESPRVQRLWIDVGTLQYVDDNKKTRVDVAVSSKQPRTKDGAPRLAIKGNGKWAGNAFTVEGTTESALALQDTDRPYAIDLHAAAGMTKAHARGTLTNPFQFEGFDLAFTLSGKNMEDLYPLVGVALPPTPPYRLDGRLRHRGDTWRYDDFTGKVGDSDLAGSASLATGGERPFLRGKLTSRLLDFDDLAGFVGGAPQTGGKESSNPELAALAAKRSASNRVLPDTPYQLDKIRAMDADVTLRAHRINAPALPLDDMDAHVRIDDGLLTLDPLNFGIAGGDIRSAIRMDARQDTLRSRADITAKGIDLGKLFPDAKLTETAIGRIGGHAVLQGRGNSIASILASSDGDVAVGMGKGQISNLLLELAGIDIYESLKFLIGKDHQVAIRCAFSDFAVKDGLMTSRSLAFDTTDTIIVGDGTIDLGDEKLDLTLNPRPKDRSILTLRSPLVIDGTFKDPGIRPDLGRLGLRGAIAIALGTITPPAALLATIELGGGEDINCGGKYAK